MDSQAMMEEGTRRLEELRSSLSEVDQQIMELVGRRNQLAESIGNVKEAYGLPLRHHYREKEVIETARARAKKYGVNEQLGEDLAMLLIQSALGVQEKNKVVASGAGAGRKCIVIGGNGLMGCWFGRFMENSGFTVTSADPSPPRGDNVASTHVNDWRTVDIGGYDIIVVATPMLVTRTVLVELARACPAGPVIFDVASLKSPIREALTACKSAGLEITSLHPMFGPRTGLLAHQHVVVVDVGCEKANQVAEGLFSSTTAKLVHMDLESHDRLIAYVLGLSHALNIAFITALAESGETAVKLANVSSTTFESQLDVARRVAEENPALYFEIQQLNDYGTESLTALLYAVERLRSVVRANDRKGFTDLMAKGNKYLTKYQPRKHKNYK